ncbi:hypothetical protein TNCV_3039081 [Trichonephila clavipes]|nr:hypothetical protein TNCV_3039081 [Trichonephila clavipes]
MLRHLRFKVFELQETKLPARLINTTNERRLVQGHGDARELYRGGKGFRRCYSEQDNGDLRLHSLDEMPRILLLWAS